MSAPCGQAPCGQHTRPVCKRHVTDNIPHLKHSGSACLLAAGSTPMSWLKGLKGLPRWNWMVKPARLRRSEANGA
jgi:hypothetical protein